MTSPHSDTETGWFRGTGGALWRIALPLNEDMAAALAIGQLVRVNHDGTPYTAPATAAPTEPPSVRDSKRDWMEWAVACGADPEQVAAATKQDLIDTYGKATPSTAETGAQAADEELSEQNGERADGRG
ncbi:hypothetical protein [Actinomadura litoris]|uniref:hypothetical protein n=1 Tax=Actinomadura litoris TaxID=2678616 RepID=UPI001FA79652|nr:hypothetical protein [Actinomadura litoris]